MKANKDGWIRHRGGKCPVEDRSTYINGRFRSGEQYHGPAYGVAWSHAGKPSDLMAWRPRKSEQATTEQSSHAEMPAAKYFDGPLQWRDRILELDAEQDKAETDHKAATEARDAERAELVAKLKAEGLALVNSTEPKNAKESGQQSIAQQDMSDWRNWKVGDKIYVVKDDLDSGYKEGQTLTLEMKEHDKYEGEMPVCVEESGEFGKWPKIDSLCWLSRPTS